MFSKFKSTILKAIGVLALIGVLIFTVIVTLAVNSNDNAVKNLSVVSARPTLFSYNNPPGEVPGRNTYYAAELTKSSGEAFGLLTGHDSSILSFDVSQEEARLRTLIFRLPEGQIVAMGNSVYPNGAVEIEANASITIAVTGGTGEYIGARGEVISTRNEDGTYTHKFTLRQ